MVDSIMNKLEKLIFNANNKATRNEAQINSLASKTVVTLNHQFTDVTARDTYFTANPTELVDKLFIKVGTGYQQYIESAWQDVDAVLIEVFDQVDDTQTALNKTWSSSKIDSTKANKVQEAWITPTLLNGFTEVSGFPVRYRKLTTGEVEFKGRLYGTSLSAQAFIVSLGYRTLVELNIPISNGYDLVKNVSINSVGSVWVRGASSTVWVDLTGVKYAAEA